VDIGRSTAVQINNAYAVAHKPPGFDVFWITVYCREPALYCEVCNLCSVRNGNAAPHWVDCVCTPLACLLECSLNILGITYLQVLKLHGERFCGEFCLS